MTDLDAPELAAAPAFSAALFAEALAALDEAEWRHSGANDRGVVGTTIEVGGRPVGGSLAVRGTVVRHVAFGTSTRDRDDAVAELFRLVNPSLDCGSFELDPVLGPVCRTGADLSGLLDEDGSVTDPVAVRLTILGLAATATGVFEAFVNVLETVAAGADPATALADAGWTDGGCA